MFLFFLFRDRSNPFDAYFFWIFKKGDNTDFDILDRRREVLRREVFIKREGETGNFFE